MALLSKQIDVALIQAHWLEALANSPLFPATYTIADFKVIEPKLGSDTASYGFPHLRSTLIYPLPGLVALPSIPPEVRRLALTARELSNWN